MQFPYHESALKYLFLPAQSALFVSVQNSERIFMFRFTEKERNFSQFYTIVTNCYLLHQIARNRAESGRDFSAASAKGECLQRDPTKVHFERCARASKARESKKGKFEKSLFFPVKPRKRDYFHSVGGESSKAHDFFPDAYAPRCRHVASTKCNFDSLKRVISLGEIKTD